MYRYMRSLNDDYRYSPVELDNNEFVIHLKKMVNEKGAEIRFLFFSALTRERLRRVICNDNRYNNKILILNFGESIEEPLCGEDSRANERSEIKIINIIEGSSGVINYTSFEKKMSNEIENIVQYLKGVE